MEKVARDTDNRQGVTNPFRQRVEDEAALREVMLPPSELVVRKELPHLDLHCVSLIRRTPLVLVATADALGRSDVSPRGDAPGFVQVLSPMHLAIPERPGNRRLDTLTNLIQNPAIGLLFVIPGMEETLRVNGRAWVVRDEEILERGVVDGRRPHLAIGVEVEAAYLHCAKAFRRGKVWQPGSWPSTEDLPSVAQMLTDHAKPEGRTAADIAELLSQDYAENMY